MKIVQVVHSFPPRYEGIGNYCYQLSKHLSERGHQVDVITSRLYSNLPVKEITNGFTIHRCPYFGTISTNRITFILNKLLNMEADIIHAHSYIFLTSNQAAIARKFRRIPLLLHLHGGLEASPPESFLTRLKLKTVKNIYDQTIGKWMLNTADVIASVSKRDIDCAKKLWELDEKNFYWIPNAINQNEFNGNNNKDHLNVVFIGRLEDGKGIKIFIEATKIIMKERDDVNFTIVGDGSLKKYVQNNSFNNRVNVLGQIPHKLIPNILSKASVLVLPSYSEGLPTVCLEALASKVPVVASNVGGIPEVVIEGETGYLFPPWNTRLCAEKVLRLLADEPLRNRMGRCGRRLVEQFYTWEKVVEKLEKIYDKISK